MNIQETYNGPPFRSSLLPLKLWLTTILLLNWQIKSKTPILTRAFRLNKNAFVNLKDLVIINFYLIYRKIYLVKEVWLELEKLFQLAGGPSFLQFNIWEVDYYLGCVWTDTHSKKRMIRDNLILRIGIL